MSSEIAMVSRRPTEAAPLWGLNEREKKAPTVVKALISTALAVLEV